MESESMDLMLEASKEDFLDEIRQLEREGAYYPPSSEIDPGIEPSNEPWEADEEFFDEFYGNPDAIDPEPEESLNHVQENVPLPAEPPVTAKVDRKPAHEKIHEHGVDIRSLNKIEWQGSIRDISDPEIFTVVKRFIDDHATDGLTLKAMASKSKNLFDLAKQFDRHLDKEFDRLGASPEILATKSQVNIFSKNQKLPDINGFKDRDGKTDIDQYNSVCEAYRLSSSFPGIYRKATGVFVVDTARRIAQAISERLQYTNNSISYRELMSSVYAASKSSVMIAKREIQAKIEVDRKRTINVEARTRQDIKRAIEAARPVAEHARTNIDLFGRTFQLRKGESAAKAVTRAQREYRASVSDRISSLEKNGLLPVLAAAVATGKGAAHVTSSHIAQAQKLIKAAKTSYGYFTTPQDLIKTALNSAQGVEKLMGALRPDTRRNELLHGLQTFGRTLSRLHDGSATIRASHRAQAAQFAADALLRAAGGVPSTENIRQAMKAARWSTDVAKQQNVRLRGLEKGTINALGDPAGSVVEASRASKRAVKALQKPIGPDVSASGQPVSQEDFARAIQEALAPLRRRRRRQDPPKPDGDDDGSPKV
jgi:hypothetical protein